MSGPNSAKFWKTALLMMVGACTMAVTAVRCDAQIVYPVHPEQPLTQDHYDAANLIMGSNPNLQGWRSLCINLKDWGAFRQGLAKTQKTLDPIKAFDNLYYMGFSSVGSWALVTSDGIIQIDTLHNADEAEKIIVADYKKAGLDPKQIKYVILTHSHAEHYGGGKYFQDALNAHILMGGPDWDIIEKTPNPPPAKRDIVVTDGQKLTLGNTTITMYVMPGHTPGTLNMIFPVTDHGVQHMVSFTGGTGDSKGHRSAHRLQGVHAALRETRSGCRSGRHRQQSSVVRRYLRGWKNRQVRQISQPEAGRSESLGDRAERIPSHDDGRSGMRGNVHRASEGNGHAVEQR